MITSNVPQETVDIDTFEKLLKQALLTGLKDQQELGKDVPLITLPYGGDGIRIFTRETRTGKCFNGGDYNYFMDVWADNEGMYLQEDWSADFEYTSPVRYFCAEHRNLGHWIDQLVKELKTNKIIAGVTLFKSDITGTQFPKPQEFVTLEEAYAWVETKVKEGVAQRGFVAVLEGKEASHLWEYDKRSLMPNGKVPKELKDFSANMPKMYVWVENEYVKRIYHEKVSVD